MGPTGGGTGMAANEQSKVSSRSMATRYRGFRGEFSDSENLGIPKKKVLRYFGGKDPLPLFLFVALFNRGRPSERNLPKKARTLAED